MRLLFIYVNIYWKKGTTTATIATDLCCIIHKIFFIFFFIYVDYGCVCKIVNGNNKSRKETFYRYTTFTVTGHYTFPIFVCFINNHYLWISLNAFSFNACVIFVCTFVRSFNFIKIGFPPSFSFLLTCWVLFSLSLSFCVKFS